MQELLNRLIDEIRGAWRFRWQAMLAAWGVAAIAWATVFSMPDTYEVTARVYVDPQTMLTEATRGLTLAANTETQIQRVRQDMLSGPELEGVAMSAGLISEATTRAQRQMVVDELRDQIQIIGTLDRNSAGTYVITHRNTNRDTGLTVVQQLLDNFVGGTVGGKRESQVETQEWLEARIAEYESRLSADESRLAEFKKKNVGLMPGTQGDYFERLQQEMQALRAAQASRDVVARRRDELARQLRGQDPVAVSGAAGEGGSAVTGSETARRIQETRTRLDDLLLRFTNAHPDAIALSETLAELEARQEEEINAVRRGVPGAAAQAGLTSNPVFQNLQLQFNQAEVEYAEISTRIAEHQRTVANLDSMVNTAPEVEAEFARLNRDHDVTRKGYQDLVGRLEAARLGQQAEATGSVQFAVLDPPTASFEPVTPNRPILIAFSLILALGVGGGVAYVLHLIKPVFSSSRQLADVTGLPVLGDVSITWIDRYRSRFRRDLLAFAGAACALVVVAGVLLTAQSRILGLIKGLNS